ncbi:hypothetical protein AAKU52_002622 [Pedobacter sp. CG_S7]|uniref:hypothetical protein n=1 Tax=Pedobacter sp. CG_S7 TaxID=3143930 RepID=UPI0033914A7F
MNIQERLMQFQDELSQRKHLMENRINILKEVGSDTTSERIEKLLSAKKELKDIQDLFYDYFYYELTSIPEELSTSNLPASISLDTLLEEDEKGNDKAAVQINRSDLETPEDTQSLENGENQDQIARPKPDMKKIISRVTELRGIHNKDQDNT